MIRFIFIIVLFSISATSNSQSWQWGKRGGSTDNLNVLGFNRPEEVYGIVTDSQNNIYVLSNVGKNGLDIDENIKTNYGDNNPLTDVALSSFSCDGTYRWSKIIGGKGTDVVNDIKIDNQDNIYIVGKFGSCGDNVYPPRIENDIILSQNPLDCSVTFIAKYNNSGVLQWFKRPQPVGTNQSDGFNSTFSMGFELDPIGNSYWLVLIPPGVYAEGAFTNTLTGSTLHVFKYDSNGVFLSAFPIDMQLSSGFINSLQFARNSYNGYLYFTSIKGTTTNTAVVGGQTITHTTFVSCFNDLGQFQWVREDTSTTPGTLFLYNLAFDSDNNIYLAGRMVGLNFNTFFGLTISGNTSPGFIMKVDPTAQNLLWSSYNNKDALERGAIIVNGNEIGYAGYCYGTDFTWGTQVLNVNAGGTGTEVLLARFNKTTGACIGLSKITGNNNFNDAGTALAVDSSGDYILGGGCGGQMTFATNSITTIGPQGDFFVAKYATSPCSLGTEEFLDEGLLLYPNPAETFVNISTNEKLSYVIYNVTGSVILQGIVTSESYSIDIATLASGCYVVSTKDGIGSVKRGKLIKK